MRPATVLPNAPPGIDDRGITDASALLAAHWSVLENRSYTVAVRSVDGSADGVPATYEVAVERPGRYVVRAGANRTPVVYTDATGVFEREFDVADGRVVGVTDDATETGVHFSVSLVPRRAHFVAPAADVERVVRDGAVYYRIHSTDPPETLAAKTGNYSMTAYVRPDGLLRTVALSYDHSRNGTWVRVDRRWTYRAVGSTSVTEPDWVPDENHTWSVRARGFCPRSPKPSS